MSQKKIKRRGKENDIMKMEFTHDNKLDKKNRFNLFFWIVSKEIYLKNKKVKGLSDNNYDRLQQICLNFTKGYVDDLPKVAIEYLDKKLEESKEIYKVFLKMKEDYILLNVKLI